jgi:membrane-bound serine protease (ClpP class)
MPRPYLCFVAIHNLPAIALALVLALLGPGFAVSYVIPVEGEIDKPLATFIERSFDQAEREGASGVVLFVDTPGGRVDAAIEISDRILASTLPTLAVVKNAFSAGALISLSARQVLMLPGSEIGAALPITASPISAPTAADRKFISALRGKFRSVAETRKRPVNVVEAMVDPDIVIPGLNSKGEVLTLTAKKAVELKVADGEVASLQAGLEKAGFNSQTQRLEPGTQVRAARFLTNPTIAAILLAVGVLGLIIEFFTPGTFVPGLIGLISLGLYFAGGLLAGLSGPWQVVLFFAGVLLVLFELFIAPGFGVPGVIGILLLMASVYLTFGTESLAVGAYSVIILAVGLFVLFRFFPRTRVGRGLVLEGAISETAPPRSELEGFMGAIGTALTDLRPAGTVQFGERRVDVVTQGEYIAKGESVRVMQIEGVRVVVKREG